jgi:hypothetical protein
VYIHTHLEVIEGFVVDETELLLGVCSLPPLTRGCSNPLHRHELELFVGLILAVLLRPTSNREQHNVMQAVM